MSRQRTAAPPSAQPTLGVRAKALNDVLDLMERNLNTPVAVWNGVLDLLDEAESESHE